MSRRQAKRPIFDSKLMADKDYWIQTLSRELGESNLRLDFERFAGPAGPMEALNISIAGSVYKRLVKVTDNRDWLVYAFLLAVFKVCLHKYTGSTSIVVGSPSIRNDDDDGSETANALAIVDDIDRQVAFRTFLLQVQETLRQSYARQDYPFDRLVKDLGIEPASNRCPLFDASLALKNIHLELPETGADLAITFVNSPDGLTGEVKYRSQLFQKVTIERFSRHFVFLLEAALANIDGAISDFQILTLPEMHEMLVEWNDTAARSSGDRCLHRLFEMQAAQAPDAIALNSESHHLSYDELNRRANQLGHYLQTVGVGPEVIVGICLERSIEMIVGLLGILKAGGAYAPIEPMYPQERIRLILKDTQAPILLTQGQLVGSLPETNARIISLDTQWRLIAGQSNENPMSDVAPENLAYAIYTSGSTGQPRGVLISHGGASSLVETQIRAFDLGSDDRTLQFASLVFDASVSEIFTTLVAGATLELGSPGAFYVGPFLTQILTTRAVTIVTLSPPIMVDTLADGMPALKTIVAAGERCDMETATRWSSGRQFINAYGPTEVAVCASLLKSAEPMMSAPSIGRPIENKQIYLLDESLRPVAMGIKGQLFVGGPGLARGYLNRPDATAEKFIPDPFNDNLGARQYATGDLACFLPDGNLTFLGRADHQVKLRGHRIELGEVESALGRHPLIKETVVVVRDNGVGDHQLIAYVVTKDGSEIAPSALRNFLKESIPEYMIPALFVTLSALPLNPSGKVDRRNLPAPSQNRPELDDSYAAPRNELESELVEIFSRILNVSKVGIYDNFFELGGHSLLAVQLISQIRDLFQVELDVIAVFEAPTVVEMGVIIVQAQMEQLDSEGRSAVLAEIEQLSENEATSRMTDGQSLYQ